MENIPVLDKELLEIEPQTSLKDDFYKFLKLLKIFLIKYCGWITFAISIAVSFWFYFTDSPKLRYDTWTSTFVSRKRLDPELAKSFDITLNGEKYENLYLTIVELENTGSKALDGRDISPIDSDPIRVIVPATIVPFLPFKNEQTSKDIHLNLIQKDQEIILDFNYLNPKSKISLSFLHKEPPENFSQNGVKVIGSAKNLKSIKEKMSYRQLLYLQMGCLFILNILAYSVYVFFRIRKYKKRKEKEKKRTDCITRQHTQLIELNKQLEEKSKIVETQNASIASLTNLKNLYLASFGLLKQRLKSNASIEDLVLVIDSFLQKANNDHK